MQVLGREKITPEHGVLVEAIADKKLLDNAAADLTAPPVKTVDDHQSTQICCRLQNPSGLSVGCK